MKSMFPLANNSIKNLRSYLKSIPNKIYSVEIKIKTQDRPREASTNINNPDEPPYTLNNLKDVKPLKTTIVQEEVVEKSKNDSINIAEQSNKNEVLNITSELNNSLKISLIDSSISKLISLNILLKQLCQHISKYPEASNFAIRNDIIPKLIKIREVSELKNKGYFTIFLPRNETSQIKTMRKHFHKTLGENSRKALSLMGHTDSPKGKGIRILSIDGGGTRGILEIEILRQIERRYGQPIHKIFDLICGVSTGAIIAMLLGGLRVSTDECESFYRHVSSYLFKKDVFRGTSRLLWSHAYYDTAVYEKTLKEIYGEKIMFQTKENKDCPHMVVISAIVNLPTLEPYLFRNYELHPSSKPLSHFEGGSSHKIWEAVRASSAAPGYFEEFTLNKHVHQDGGIILNNPTAVAVHEAKLLWPNEEIQCVVSLGSGRFQPPNNHQDNSHMEKEVTLSSLKHKILRLIDSATDTEMVHRLMQDMLPYDAYYRINPMLQYNATIDENRPEKLEQMKQDAIMYLRKNEHKFKKTIKQLKLERTLFQSLKDNISSKYKIYF